MRKLVCGVGVGVVALLTSASVATSERSTADSGTRCPTGRVRQVEDVAAVVQAARRLLIRGKSISARGVKYRLTDRNAPIVEVVSLSPIFPGIPGASAFRASAAGRCGARIASASWAVVVYYTLAPMATSSIGRAFVVLTDRGWRVY